jgi:hypothetical protein
MWMLFLIMTGLVQSMTYLEKYPTLEQCETEKVRIKSEFDKSYPNDHDYRFECIERKVTHERTNVY